MNSMDCFYHEWYGHLSNLQHLFIIVYIKKVLILQCLFFYTLISCVFIMVNYISDLIPDSQITRDTTINRFLDFITNAFVFIPG